jgi:hypothetical protein
MATTPERDNPTAKAAKPAEVDLNADATALAKYEAFEKDLAESNRVTDWLKFHILKTACYS